MRANNGAVSQKRGAQQGPQEAGQQGSTGAPEGQAQMMRPPCRRPCVNIQRTPNTCGSGVGWSGVVGWMEDCAGGGVVESVPVARRDAQQPYLAPPAPPTPKAPACARLAATVVPQLRLEYPPLATPTPATSVSHPCTHSPAPGWPPQWYRR